VQQGYFIRPINPDDYEPLRALHTAAIMAVDPAIYTDYQKQGWAHGLTAEGYGRAVASGEVFDVACDPAGQPVGFCGCKGDEIYGLYVHPKAQGKSVGAELLLRGEDRLREWGALRCSLLQAKWLAVSRADGLEVTRRTVDEDCADGEAVGLTKAQNYRAPPHSSPSTKISRLPAWLGAPTTPSFSMRSMSDAARLYPICNRRWM
jgi:GNAT superfamily N-acetyltransferase